MTSCIINVLNIYIKSSKEKDVSLGSDASRALSEILHCSINALDASNPRPKYCAFLDFVGRGRTLLLQDVAQLINIVHTHILFDDEVFKTELFLNYKETVSNFCSTSVNPVSRSLKDVLTEL